ncbi:MAG: flagellar export protein FliJ [Helicobacteraceae bacterium]|nr:flagellar export protein FliJ [Helicobacteraceae bacterium]
MKTKFSGILKLKNDILKKIEREILEVNSLIQAKEQEILALKNSLSSLSPPSGRKYAEFLAFRENLSNIRITIDNENNLLEMFKARKIDILKQYKIAKIEYEKINYLHLEEVKNILKAAKAKEQLELDEFGGILHYIK